MADLPFGWVPDEDGLQEQTEQRYWYDEAQQQVQALIEADDNEDTFHYRALRQFRPAQYRDDRLLSLNQGSVGSCVGVATARLIDHLQALDISFRNQSETFCGLTCPEWCYATGREAGGMLGGGDGSTNSGQLKALERFGVLFQQEYQGYDLRKYETGRCRDWGKRGVPEALKAEAVKHKLLKSYRVRSVAEWWSLAGAGYPINLCSGWGGSGSRDSDGYMRKNQRWAHSMGNPGTRRKHSSRGKSFLICNSWGSGWANSGAIWPDDMPFGSFWIGESDASWIIKNGEVIAYADFEGGFQKPYQWNKEVDWSKDDVNIKWGDDSPQF